MKNYIIFLAMLIISSSFGQTPIPTKSTIAKATVFIDGAQITRTANLSLHQGKSTFIFKGLSPYIDKKSVKVKGDGNFTVLSVNTSTNFLEEASSDSAKLILKQISNLKADRELLSVKKQILNEQLSFLTNNKKVQSNEKTLSPSDFQAYNTYYSKAFSKIKMDLLQNQRALVLNTKNIDKLNNQYRNMVDNKDLPTYEISIVVSSKQVTNGAVELNYYVENAGWYPSYDLRVENIETPVDLIYKANLHQNTGVDWKNVKLTFSNATPTISGNMPSLAPYYLGYNPNSNTSYNASIRTVKGIVRDIKGEPLIGASIYIEGTTIGTVADVKGLFELSVPNGARRIHVSYIGYGDKEIIINSAFLNVVLDESVALEDVVVNDAVIRNIATKNISGVVSTTAGIGGGREYSSKGSRSRRAEYYVDEVKTRASHSKQNFVDFKTKRHETSFEFEIDTPYSIVSDGKVATIQIQNLEMPTSYVFKSIPKLNKSAFLIANITDWEKFDLLDGEVNLYYENTFIGKSLIDLSSANDTLAMSLGVDKNISIERIKEKQYSKKQFIGKYAIQNRIWKTTIRNNKSAKIKILIYDQIPISREKNYKITVDELSDGALNKTTGEVVWKLDIAPKTEIVKKLGYSVKYLKRIQLGTQFE